MGLRFSSIVELLSLLVVLSAFWVRESSSSKGFTAVARLQSETGVRHSSLLLENNVADSMKLDPSGGGNDPIILPTKKRRHKRHHRNKLHRSAAAPEPSASPSKGWISAGSKPLPLIPSDPLNGRGSFPNSRYPQSS
ncbi:hypothetical protein M569_00432 [Genlisea aurea]|uniref:Uncharacterized protein n=1 Tax=Genlisea aurea TaxID=192259 RepID=S8EEB2_9LAMI|nr:hypothetical protein M569_00432 [Genlisea aurea]